MALANLKPQEATSSDYFNLARPISATISGSHAQDNGKGRSNKTVGRSITFSRSLPSSSSHLNSFRPVQTQPFVVVVFARGTFTRSLPSCCPFVSTFAPTYSRSCHLLQH
ncbi:hypothetical protein HZ326_11353 [Fusarium oxysporum f. sp. albedinis]|nr:hypothetical protein HZ326_11353 [Fusarium oxysporum f. sp. albedinis]